MRIRHMEVPDAVRAGTEVALNCDYDLQVGKKYFNLLDVTLVCDDSDPFLITTCRWRQLFPRSMLTLISFHDWQLIFRVRHF